MVMWIRAKNEDLRTFLEFIRGEDEELRGAGGWIPDHWTMLQCPVTPYVQISYEELKD